MSYTEKKFKNIFFLVEIFFKNKSLKLFVHFFILHLTYLLRFDMPKALPRVSPALSADPYGGSTEGVHIADPQ